MMILEKINGFVWGGGLIFLLLFTGTVLTIRLKFIQLRLPILLLKNGKSQNSGLSQLKTVCMSLGTTMGTGNIVGAASALALGGAGSIFWMWVSAFLGMSIVYAENVLSAKYSDKTLKGPMAYISKGLGFPALGAIFAVFCVLASLGMGGMVQVNTFTEALGNCTDFSRPVAALVIFLLIMLTVHGGGERIGTAAQYLLPAASAAYAAVCVAAIVIYKERLPEVFRSIFSEAFDFRSAAGGIFGYALSVGIRRGIFSNEAGLGSSPILHSAAETSSPHTQGLWSMFEVFFDTILCCTLTAVTVLCGSESFSVTEAVSAALGSYSDTFITAELGIFAFCTVIGWYYCGMTAFSHISKGRYIGIFAAVYSCFAASGAIFSSETLWTLSDIFNGLMAFPNLLAILLLMPKIKDHTSKNSND
ncbi:MAG: sodium:alanine symporter family protein [Ruminococcus sp.]|nr:sodium:alanine symporter family protein [Ruminococcus sp.]MBO5164941.1 sodium:alanine symporter family protein [Ruminococcus sp.]